MEKNGAPAEITSLKAKPVIIAIGSSAGGLEALQDFLSFLPAALQNASIIIAQHVGHSPKSMLVHILSSKTSLSVVEARNGDLIVPGTVYVTPEDKDIVVVKNTILLKLPGKRTGSKPSIDIFFRSLSSIKNTAVFAIVMSGSGKDGSEGIKEAREAGVTIIAEDLASAKFDSMPASAAGTGFVDAILAPADMGKEILRIVLSKEEKTAIAGHKEEISGINQLFEMLSERWGTDFSNYKPSTIYRRINKRLDLLKLSNLNEYVEYIHAKPAELDALYNVLLIGVTSFFRDKEAFEVLGKQLKLLLLAKTDGLPLRVWVIGCATGEEAYSIAVILLQLMKESNSQFPLQVFATDIDEKALAVARKGMYNKKSVEGVAAAVLADFFTKKGDSWEVKKLVRERVLFSKHDITTNPPFHKIDVICCRNLLIYFGPLLQKYILPLFHYALNPGGILFLGKSESVGNDTDRFTTADAKNKVYIKRVVHSMLPVKFPAFTTPFDLRKNFSFELDKQNSIKELIKDTLLNTLEHPYAVINENADIQEVSGDLRLFLTLPAGTMNANLFKLINAELRIDTIAAYNAVKKDFKACKTRLKKFRLFDKDHYVIINIKPVLQAARSGSLFLVLFETLELPVLDSDNIAGQDIFSVTRVRELELELASTREYLLKNIEELECTNQELQSTNEELQSTNEELQSTGEELESANEELIVTSNELLELNKKLENTSVQKQQVNTELSESNIKLALAYEDLQKNNELLAENESEIKKSFYKGEENKSNLISAELHDNINQKLVAANLFLGSFTKNRKEDNLTVAMSLVKESIAEIRDLSHLIEGPRIKDHGFIRSIENFLKQLNNAEMTQFKLASAVKEDDINEELQIAVYRIIQEQVSNIIKYSNADLAHIEILQVKERLTVSIKDDGIGFDTAADTDGIGLLNIAARAKLFNGNIEIKSAPGKGCELTATFTLDKNAILQPDKY